MIIRIADPEDKNAIVEFQQQMALETESLILDNHTLAKGVETVFLNPDSGQYFVAEVNNEVIASLLITFEWSDWRNKVIWWIQSVYVKPDFRKQGVFKAMYEYLKDHVNKRNDIGGLRLYVDLNNSKAQTVYKKLGMNGEHYQVFEWMK